MIPSASPLPQQCPLCKANPVQYQRPSGEDCEGALYGCGLDLFMHEGHMMRQSYCDGGLTEWLEARNAELAKLEKANG